MDKLKIGIIGTGSISEYHTKGYQKLENAEIVAVCDINLERAQQVAATHGIANAYSDYNKMLQAEKLDGVSICTWNNGHAPASIAALEAGVNVLCEKPMALNTMQAVQMQKAAEKSGKLLMIGFVRRFAAATEIAKDFISQGDLGNLYYVKTSCIRRCGNPMGWFADKSRSGGGPLIDLGVHMIDLSRYLMGGPKAVSVYGATFGEIGPRNQIKHFSRYLAKDVSDFCDVEDMAVAMIRFENGAVLNLEVSFSSHIKEDVMTLDLYGSRAGMKIEPRLEMYSEKYNYLTNVTPVVSSDGFENLFNREMAHFVDCISHGTACISPATDGVEMMRILDAIYLSAKEKTQINI